MDKKAVWRILDGRKQLLKTEQIMLRGSPGNTEMEISPCFVRSIGTLGLDAGHGHAKSGGQFMSLLRRLGQSLLQCFGREHQTAWLSFCSLCHVAASVMVSWLANCVATGKA